jgi:hypothetical protein
MLGREEQPLAKQVSFADLIVPMVYVKHENTHVLLTIKPPKKGAVGRITAI